MTGTADFQIGSICTGYGGLDAGVMAVIGGQLAWVADNDKGPAAILAHRFPGVPNLGDITRVPWEKIPPVGVLCAGFPCQPVSTAGRMRGLSDERWIWPAITQGIGRMVTPPRLLVLENVPRLLSADGGAAMAQVIYSLAALGYVGRYGLFRASHAGACHRRERWFCLAVHRDAAAPNTYREQLRNIARGLPPSAGSAESERDQRQRLRADLVDGSADGDAGSFDQLRISTSGSAVKLFRTPGGNLGTNGGGQSAAKRLAGGHHPSIEDQVMDLPLLPTPQAHDSSGAKTPTQISEMRARSHRDSGGPPGISNLNEIVPHKLVSNGAQVDWLEYGPAVRRWEAVSGQNAPCPVEEGKNGKPRLAAPFAEWMMGLPPGWVTDVPGLSRGAQLKAIGNGVVPHQAALALSSLWQDVDDG